MCDDDNIKLRAQRLKKYVEKNPWYESLAAELLLMSSGYPDAITTNWVVQINLFMQGGNFFSTLSIKPKTIKLEIKSVGYSPNVFCSFWICANLI